MKNQNMRFKDRVYLSSPTMHSEEQKYIKEAFDTNWVAPLGTNVNELEREIADYLGCEYAAALTSGTAALHLAVKLAGVGPGDVVFCSDLTFAATVNPVSYEGGTQVFIDSEQDTWNMDPAALERAFEKYDGRVHEDGKYYPVPKAVIVVNLYGIPAKLDEIKKLCNKNHVILIEDAAESLSATYKGQQTGTFGDYNIVSFNGNKIITTSGGGMLLSNSAKAVEKVRFWATQSREDYPWYEHREIGYNYRMSNIVAGIGRGQLIHLDEHRERKKHIYFKYQEAFRRLPVKMNPYLSSSEPNFWLSCMVMELEAVQGVSPKYPAVTPTMIRERLAEYNIESRPIWKPMHLQPVYQHMDFITVMSEHSVGEDIFARGICLPSDIKMTDETQDIIIEIIEDMFDGNSM